MLGHHLSPVGGLHLGLRQQQCKRLSASDPTARRRSRAGSQRNGTPRETRVRRRKAPTHDGTEGQAAAATQTAQSNRTKGRAKHHARTLAHAHKCPADESTPRKRGLRFQKARGFCAYQVSNTAWDDASVLDFGHPIAKSLGRGQFLFRVCSQGARTLRHLENVGGYIGCRAGRCGWHASCH